jgi:hypothetical protein
MKSLLLAVVVSVAAMTAAGAQTPSHDAIKACMAQIAKAQPLSLGQNVNSGGFFWLDKCLRG